MTDTPRIPSMRTYYRKAVVSTLSVMRRDGGFVFSITRRGKDPVEHWLSEQEAATLGLDLQHPEYFGPEVAVHHERASDTRSEGA